MKSMLLILGAVVVIILSPTVVTSVNDFRTNDQVDPFNVTTGPAETTTTVTLSQPLYNNATSGVSISSNVTADAPLALSYVSGTKVLTVSGLQESLTHQLTVTYDIDALGDYIGASTGASTIPLFLILGIIGVIVGAVYTATRHGE